MLIKKLISNLLILTVAFLQISPGFAQEQLVEPVDPFNYSPSELEQLLQSKVDQLEALKKSLEASQINLYKDGSTRAITRMITQALGGLAAFGSTLFLLSKAVSPAAPGAATTKLAKLTPEALKGISQHLPAIAAASIVSIAISLSALTMLIPPDVEIVTLTDDEKRVVEEIVQRLEKEITSLQDMLQQVRASNIVIQ